MADLLPNAPREFRFTGEELALEAGDAPLFAPVEPVLSTQRSER